MDAFLGLIALIIIVGLAVGLMIVCLCSQQWYISYNIETMAGEWTDEELEQRAKTSHNLWLLWQASRVFLALFFLFGMIAVVLDIKKFLDNIQD